MPTIPLASQLYAPGQKVQTASVVIPANLAQARITLNLSAVQLQDPLTLVKAQVEWAPAGTPDVSPLWSMMGSTQLRGNPLNKPTLVPYIAANAAWLAAHPGDLVRAWAMNESLTPITFDATVIFT